jgi:hypothetical protein
MKHVGGGHLRADLRPRRPAGRLLGLRGPRLHPQAPRRRGGLLPRRHDDDADHLRRDAPGCYEPKARVEDMEMNHVEASLCFPTFPRFCGQTFTEAKDRELGWPASTPTTTGWSRSGAATPDGRLIPLIIIPLWDAELAAAEVRRNAERGVHAVCFSEIPPHLGLPSIHSGHWDPFFAACEETDHRVHAHRLVVEDAGHLARRPGGVAATLSFNNAMASLSDFLFSGVLVRFPTEAGLLRGPDRLDPLHPRAGRRRVEEHRAGRRGRPDPRAAVDLLLPPGLRLLLPRPARLDSLDEVGVDNITFETDYPHTDSTWPDTEGGGRGDDGRPPDEDVDKIMRGNAIRMLVQRPRPGRARRPSTATAKARSRVMCAFMPSSRSAAALDDLAVGGGEGHLPWPGAPRRGDRRTQLSKASK